MKIYFDGRYWDEQCSLEDKELLKSIYPIGYNRLFGKVVQSTCNPRLSLYQIYYNRTSQDALDYGFIPYKTEKAPHNYENDVILDIWRRRDWIKSKYVGVLSWRFFEKTGLSANGLRLKGDINYFVPQKYERFEHPFSRKGFESVNRMVEVADKHCLFPFKLAKFNVKDIIWCNYWAVTPEVFDDYCTNYLSKAIEFFKTRPEYELKERHRGSDYYAMTFFLEGLFSIFVSQRNYKLVKHGI